LAEISAELEFQGHKPPVPSPKMWHFAVISQNVNKPMGGHGSDSSSLNN